MKLSVAVLALFFLPALAKADTSTVGELFTYQNGVFTFLGQPDDGLPLLPPGFYSRIRPNDLGQTTTFTQEGNGPQLSFIVNADGSMTPLNLPSGCIAFGGINDSGQIAGVCNRPGYTATGENSVVGFIDTGGSFAYASYQIPGNGSLTQTYFEGINDQGEVVGSYDLVAEPSTILLLGVGLAALLFKFRGL